jgi:hypothetical protein
VALTDAQAEIESAIAEAERLRRILRKGTGRQVSSDDERRVVRATVLTWFRTHRPAVVAVLNEGLLESVDNQYRSSLAAADKASLRTLHLECLKKIKRELAKLRSDHVVSLSVAPPVQSNTPDLPPQFSPLVTDLGMQKILGNRWSECVKCVTADAPLAATVMMGGLLEALLLARINQHADKKPVLNAQSAPRDKQTGKTLNLKLWGLRDFIAVAHELQWISAATRDIGNIMRDYRNYIHPQKEHSHGISISNDDARALWEVAKSICRQVLRP